MNVLDSVEYKSQPPPAKNKWQLTLTNDALCRMAQAIIQDAIRVIRLECDETERRDAAQFLVAHDGAELWLKIAGIGVTKRMRGDLKQMALGRFERSRNG